MNERTIGSFNPEVLEQLQTIQMPGNTLLLTPGKESLYESAYQFWYDTVIEGLQSENLQHHIQHLCSDEFIRQNEIYSLFHNDQPIGLFAFSWLNLNFKATRQQHYLLNNYPGWLIDQLCDQGQHFIMTMGHLTVHPNWRRHKIGPCVSEILVGFAVKRLLESPALLCLSFSRNNRQTNKLSYRYGAKPLIQNYKAYGIDSDILALYRDSVCECPIPGIQTAVNKLWAEQMTISIAPNWIEKKMLSSIG